MRIQLKPWSVKHVMEPRRSIYDMHRRVREGDGPRRRRNRRIGSTARPTEGGRGCEPGAMSFRLTHSGLQRTP